jgi:apolipoprotein D and lipocalin family protein
MKITVLALLFLTASVSATFSWGWCPSRTPQAKFNAQAYMGTWYELVRNKDMPYELGNCNKAQYTLLDTGYISVNNSEIVNDELSFILGSAYCEKGVGQCYVRFSELAPWGDYEVLATDYESYSVVFSCFSVFFAHWKWAWVLSRDISLDATNFLPTIEGLGIPASALYFTSQTGCSH